MIKVVRIYERPKAEYIGRAWNQRASSPLANPYRLMNERDRDVVCDKYKQWFDEKVINDPAVMKELRRLKEIAETGDLELGCFCSPKRCHGDTIKAFLESM
jgi:hypothetical protein